MQNAIILYAHLFCAQSNFYAPIGEGGPMFCTQCEVNMLSVKHLGTKVAMYLIPLQYMAVRRNPRAPQENAQNQSNQKALSSCTLDPYIKNDCVFTAAYLKSCPMKDDGFTNSDPSTDSHSSPNGDIGTQLHRKKQK